MPLRGWRRTARRTMPRFASGRGCRPRRSAATSGTLDWVAAAGRDPLRFGALGRQLEVPGFSGVDEDGAGFTAVEEFSVLVGGRLREDVLCMRFRFDVFSAGEAVAADPPGALGAFKLGHPAGQGLPVAGRSP